MLTFQNIATGSAFTCTWRYHNDPVSHEWCGTKVDSNHVKWHESDTSVEFPAPNTTVVNITITQQPKHGKNPTKKPLRAPHQRRLIPLSDVVRNLLQAEQFEESFVTFCATSPCRKTLPVECWQEWAAVVKGSICKLQAAVGTADEDAAALQLLLLPRLYLDKRLKTNAIFFNLRARNPKKAELNTLQDELDEETKCISRATALAKDHFLSRAVKTLYADKVAKTTPQVIAHLQSKHPQENATAQKRPQDRCVSIDAEEFKIAVDRLPNGASPGWSGWTKELLSAAIKADSSIVAPLSALCTSLLHGTATEHFTRALLIGKLIGIEKPTNTPQSMDLRPITISDTFLKLSGSVALAYRVRATEVSKRSQTSRWLRSGCP